MVKNFSYVSPREKQLGCYQWGESESKPVLFISGAGMNGSLGLDPKSFLQRGLKLIGIDRPGLVESTFDRDKSLLTWIDDITGLIHHGNDSFC